MGSGELGQLGEWSRRNVVEYPYSSQALALVSRMGSVADELVAVGRAALVVKEQAVLGMWRGQQEDKTEVSTAPAVENMEVDVMVVERQRRGKCKDWTSGHC
jgi:hypothetical protein